MISSQLMKLWLSSLPLLLLLVTDRVNGTDISRCPLYQQYFQKILGYRPDFQLIGNTHELYPPANSDTFPTNGNDINATAYAVQNYNNGGRRDAINVDCWQRCRDNVECSGYVLFLNVSQCYGISQINRSSPLYTPMLSAGLLLDTNSVYFEKICLSDGELVIDTY